VKRDHLLRLYDMLEIRLSHLENSDPLPELRVVVKDLITRAERDRDDRKQ
jgi:hypothetical protein